MSSLSSVGGANTASSLLSSTSSTTGTLSVGGLVSGLNTSQIIQGLLAVQQQQITAVQTRESAVQARETAYKALQAQLLGFQTGVTQLAQTVNGPFDGRTATSSNTAAVTAAGSGGAVPGVYALTVNALAQANEVASQGFAGATGPISTGTLTVGSGGQSATITIDNTNNTLQGLASAINAAAAGVNAAVVNTGAAGQPYRLLLTATRTGTANAITLTNNLGPSDPASGTARPQFGQNAVGAAVAAAGNQGTAAATSGGTFTGTENNTYTFTVAANGGGTVGTDTITLNYADATGTHKGTLTLNPGDLNQPKDVAEGVRVTFGAGTLVAGDKFSVNTTVPTVQAAADASVTLGSGGGALTVTSSSNTVNAAIDGVTLSLLQTTPSSQPVQITVANDTTTAQTAVQNFVTAYNAVINTIANDVSYDPSTKRAGVLLGDPSVLNIENQLRDLVIQPVTGANPKLNSLSALGVTSNAGGQLSIDGTTLNNVLSGKVSGVTLNDVRKLFAVGGQSTNAGVAFANATSATKASAAPYGVVVTGAARQAVLTGTALGANTPVTSGGNTFTLTVNGTASNTIAVPPSSGPGYTQQALVAALQAQINADSKVGALGVTVGLQNNQLTFTTANYGQGAKVGISAASFLGFGGPASANGQDVAGSFLVNGTPEAATGSGQLLTGNSGNANTTGLAVNVTLLPSQISPTPTTPVANVSVTQGVAAQLATALNGLLDPTTGQLQTIDQNFQDQISTYGDQVKQLQAQYNAKQAQLQTQFSNLESTLSNLKGASSFLSAQTAALQSFGGSSSSTGH
jgi:flagellar hook-associated protein 2